MCEAGWGRWGGFCSEAETWKQITSMRRCRKPSRWQMNRHTCSSYTLPGLCGKVIHSQNRRGHVTEERVTQGSLVWCSPGFHDTKMVPLLLQSSENKHCCQESSSFFILRHKLKVPIFMVPYDILLITPEWKTHEGSAYNLQEWSRQKWSFHGIRKRHCLLGFIIFWCGVCFRVLYSTQHYVKGRKSCSSILL